MVSSDETIRLNPVFDDPRYYEELENRIIEAFRKILYEPIIKEFRIPGTKLKNASDSLADAIRSGRVTFVRGSFQGRFNARISRELRAIGARWDRKTASYKIAKRDIPDDIRSAIALSEVVFKEKLDRIDERLSKILPESFSESIKVKDVFETSIWKTEKNLDKTLKAITVQPELSPWQRDKIADEWTNNMERSIKDFTDAQIKKLRKTLQKSYMAGQRYETAVKMIQESFHVSERKAKFLARQEMKLLISKFKETRYIEAGIHEYQWKCVVGSPKHPVRPSHKILEGKIFRFDDPPVTTGPGEPERKNNPGEDYNCRCFAIPVVRKKSGKAPRP